MPTLPIVGSTVLKLDWAEANIEKRRKIRRLRE
jgi:hypothetical protein